MGLAIKTSALGVGAFILSRIPARATTIRETEKSPNRSGEWKIELLNGYPYPAAIIDYSSKARFSSPEQALENFRSRKWPVKVVNLST